MPSVFHMISSAYSRIFFLFFFFFFLFYEVCMFSLFSFSSVLPIHSDSASPLLFFFHFLSAGGPIGPCTGNCFHIFRLEDVGFEGVYIMTYLSPCSLPLAFVFPMICVLFASFTK